MGRRRRMHGSPAPEPDWGRQIEEIASQMASFNLVMSETTKHRLLRFTSQLVAWNERYALVSRQDIDNVLRKHVAASLGPLLMAPPNPNEAWVDVGTGAGFPGMILKLWSPEQPITLIDGSRKKCLFVEQIARDLDLGPIPVLQLRVETLVARGELLGRFAVLFARAVANLASTLKEFGPLVRQNGQIISFKGPTWSEDVRMAEQSGFLSSDRFILEEVLRIPWAPGHLLRVRKVGDLAAAR